MVGRHAGLALLWAALLLWFPAAWAMEPGAKRLLVVDTQNTEPYTTITGAMLHALAQQGWAEGRNLQVLHIALGRPEGAAENIWRYDHGPDQDVVYLAGAIANKAFLPIIKSAPNSRFVFAAVTDPVGLGLIEGFGVPPTGNVTGISLPVPARDRLRFIRRLLPNAHTLGLIDGDLPESDSYRASLDRLVAEEPEFRGLKILYRRIDFISGDNGPERMAGAAPPLVKELDPQVDAFLSPNDQMGINPEYTHQVATSATKPLVGIVEPDVRAGGRAAMTIYPSLTGMGEQAARMIAQLLAGAPIASLPAETPGTIGVAFDWPRIRHFGIAVPADLAERARHPPPG
jgi:putative ABC transport system substrate-binding protein